MLSEASTSARLTCLCAVEEVASTASQEQPKQAWKAAAAAEAAAASEEQTMERSQPQKSRRDEQMRALDSGQPTGGAAAKKQKKGDAQLKGQGVTQKKKALEAAEGVVVRRPGESEAVVEFPADTSQSKKKGKKKS